MNKTFTVGHRIHTLFFNTRRFSDAGPGLRFGHGLTDDYGPVRYVSLSLFGAFSCWVSSGKAPSEPPMWPSVVRGGL